MTEPVTLFRDFMRTYMIDPNTARAAAGINWIYDDFPREDLKLSSYPRISIIETNESAKPLGFRSDHLWTIMDFQIDIIVKNESYYDIDVGSPPVSTYFADIGLCRKLARDVEEAFRNNWTNLACAGTALTYALVGRTPPSYNVDKKIWKISLDYEFETDINDNY